MSQGSFGKVRRMRVDAQGHRETRKHWESQEED